MPFSRIPEPRGLYDPDQETDSCGVAVVADTSGRHLHSVVDDALAVLGNLSHRGAVGRESNSGDGAGILIQLPTEFFDAVTEFELPPPNAMGENTYAAWEILSPVDQEARWCAGVWIHRYAAAEGLQIIGWRGASRPRLRRNRCRAVRSVHQSVFCYVPSHEIVVWAELPWTDESLPSGDKPSGFTVPTLQCISSSSARTIVYKGMLTPTQLPGYFTDLRDHRMRTALAVVHSSDPPYTSVVATRSAVSLHRPQRRDEYDCGKQELDARSRADAAEHTFRWGHLSPVSDLHPGKDHSSSFDEVLELSTLGGRSVQHAIAMMIPGAWENDSSMPDEIKAFYQFHGCLMEPWDGPASVTFSDGIVVGAVLDRNGLRPGRWWRMKSDRIVLASESGVFDAPTSEVLEKGRLEPGRMFLVDTARHRIVSDAEIQVRTREHSPLPGLGRRGIGRPRSRDCACPRRSGSAVATAVALRIPRRGPAGHSCPDGKLRIGAVGIDGCRHASRLVLWSRRSCCTTTLFSSLLR